jgi:hypothetical protein
MAPPATFYEKSKPQSKDDLWPLFRVSKLPQLDAPGCRALQVANATNAIKLSFGRLNFLA